MENLVACIIVNYNDWARTLSLVNKIVDYRSISHVIVINNSSTDDSAIHLNSFSNYKYIYIEAPKNGGYGYGNNLGINKAAQMGDKYILIVNPDVEFSNECIEDMIIKYQCDEKCAIINAHENKMSISGWKYTSGIVDVLCISMLMNRIFKNKRYYNSSYYRGTGVVKTDVIPGNLLLIDTNLMLQYGMYDEDFFLYNEEKILHVKFDLAGYYSLTDLDVSYQHNHIEHAGKNVSDYIRGKKNLIDSTVLFCKKYRKFNHFEMMLTKLFFKLTILEMGIYAFFIVLLERWEQSKKY